MAQCSCTGSTLGKDAEDVRTGAVLHARNGSSHHHVIGSTTNESRQNRTDEEENRVCSRLISLGVAVGIPPAEESSAVARCILIVVVLLVGSTKKISLTPKSSSFDANPIIVILERLSLFITRHPKRANMSSSGFEHEMLSSSKVHGGYLHRVRHYSPCNDCHMTFAIFVPENTLKTSSKKMSSRT